MKFLTKERLEKLTTKRILAYLRSLYVVHEGPNWDEHNKEITKSSIEWKEQVKLVKSILATREHLSNE